MFPFGKTTTGCHRLGCIVGDDENPSQLQGLSSSSTSDDVGDVTGRCADHHITGANNALHCVASNEVTEVIYNINVVGTEEQSETESDHVCFLSGIGGMPLFRWDALCRLFKARVNCGVFAVCHRRRSRCACALARVRLHHAHDIRGYALAQSWSRYAYVTTRRRGIASLRDEDDDGVFVDFVNGFVVVGGCVASLTSSTGSEGCGDDEGFVDFVNVMASCGFVHRLFSFAEDASICPHFLRFSTKNHLQTYV